MARGANQLSAIPKMRSPHGEYLQGFFRIDLVLLSEVRRFMMQNE